MWPSLTEHQSETQCHKLDPTMIACDSLPFFGNLFDVVFLVFSMIEDGQYPWTPHFCHPDDCFDCCSFSSNRRQLHRIITRITIIFVWCSSHTEMENISFLDIIGKLSTLWRLNINFCWFNLIFWEISILWHVNMMFHLMMYLVAMIAGSGDARKSDEACRSDFWCLLDGQKIKWYEIRKDNMRWCMEWEMGKDKMSKKWNH